MTRSVPAYELTMSATKDLSPSLVPSSDEDIEYYKKRFTERNPAIFPSGPVTFSQSSYPKLSDGSGQVSLRSDVDSIVGFFDTDPSKAVLRIMITQPMDGMSDFFKFLMNTLGPANSSGEPSVLGRAYASQFKTLTANNKPPGVTAKNLAKSIEADLTARQGQKSAVFARPLKIKEGDGEDDPSTVTLGFPIYWEDKKSTRQGPDVAPEIEEVFGDIPDHPVYQFAQNNPTAVVKFPPITVAAGNTTTTALEIIRAMSFKSSKGQWYIKCLGSVSYSCGFHYTPRKTMVWDTFLNRPWGLKVFAVPMNNRTAAVADAPGDADIYAAKRPRDSSFDESSVYMQTAAKRTRLASDAGGPNSSDAESDVE